MDSLKQKSQYAKENLEFSTYREKIDKLEKELHQLRDQLSDEEVSILQDLGYKPINIDGFKIMVPLGMTMKQLRVSLQQMPPPDENDDRAIKFLVSDEDKSAVHERKSYQEIVEKRKEIIDEINNTYEEFRDEQVKPISDSEEETIVYMLVGLDRDIRSRKLNSITGISKNKCKEYYLKDGIVKKR